MNLKKNFLNLFLLVLILLVLISPILYWISLRGNWEKVSVVEGRKLAVFPKDTFQIIKSALKQVIRGKLNEANKLFFKKVIDESFQKQIASAIADQFPLRIKMTEFSRTIERGLISAAYTAVPDPAIPASIDSQIFVTRDKSRLLPPPISFNLTRKNSIDLRIENYKKLLNENPRVNFFIFNIETIHYSKFHPLATYFNNADNGRSLIYFIENKPYNLGFECFKISSYEDFESNYFRTDHHWNINGALKAYRLLYNLVSSKYEDISPMVEIRKISPIQGVEFLGSYARKSLYPIKPEAFEYADVALPLYKTYVNNELKTFGGRAHYLLGNFSRDKYVDHYRGFYGSWEKIIMYEFQNPSERNLLIIASSYARMDQELLASHYHRTYVIDLRDDDVKAISLSQMMKEYQIDDVLIIGQPSVTYSSSQYLITP
ncbi:MAG: hypothetical protein Q8N39_11310 [Pelolinea sp.]|nr:hypothetical protein [Pelolinea sp.]